MTIIRTRAQEAAVAVLRETLKLVRADVLVKQCCWRDGNALLIAGSEIDLTRFDRILVLGAGKASAAMAQAILEILDGFAVEGSIVTKYGHGLELPDSLTVIEAGHPRPSSIKAVTVT